MSDCQHRVLVVGEIYNVHNIGIYECGLCHSPLPNQVRATYAGHELHLGQMAAAFFNTPVFHCNICHMKQTRFWWACGDGWTSDLFTRQRESVEVDTRQPEPAEEATR